MCPKKGYPLKSSANANICHMFEFECLKFLMAQECIKRHGIEFLCMHANTVANHKLDKVYWFGSRFTAS